MSVNGDQTAASYQFEIKDATNSTDPCDVAILRKSFSGVIHSSGYTTMVITSTPSVDRFSIFGVSNETITNLSSRLPGKSSSGNVSISDYEWILVFATYNGSSTARHFTFYIE